MMVLLVFDWFYLQGQDILYRDPKLTTINDTKYFVKGNIVGKHIAYLLRRRL
jgi:hypothetical protein